MCLPFRSPKTRPLSPAPTKHILSGPPPPPGPGYSSPRLSGPGRTSTPTGHVQHHATPSSSGLGLGQQQQPPLADAVLQNGIGATTATTATSASSASASASYHNNPVSSRTASPLMASLHAPPGRSTTIPIPVNGVGGGGGGGGGSAGGGHNVVVGPDRDRMDRERHSSPRLGASSSASSSSVSNIPPPPPPSKLGTAQMVDGH